ncbi:putative monocarboxylate permease [Lepidopterella palustris CBS 459.81]|uniref:Putative monocarboxylate permease n=1 Tax=Lepidopterella palustris CBS 459.81 TaxID=1314670 RepID=A0A8E2E314_9PEZI|nr:putative monocarboxylate permease [Lepidopterella palustris CBS 459.81]
MKNCQSHEASNGVPTDNGKAAEAIAAPVAQPATPQPPPNGGLKAWLAVLGGFFFVLNSWGMANSFGVFQTYYATTMLPTSTPSAISWIGSIQAFLLLFVGVLCGRALDAGHYNVIFAVGTFFEVFGMMMTSLGTKYYQIFLAQGVCVGVGSGLIFTSGVSIVATYFTTRRAFAMGLVSSGSSVGGIIYPIAVRQIINHTGFGWATRAMAFIMLGSLLLGFVLLRPRLPPRKSGPFFDLESFKDPAYTSFVIGLALAFMAYFIPFFYIESFALRIGTSEHLSFYILAIMNAAGTLGRIVPNFIADRVGNLNVIIPITYISGLIVLLWLTVHHTGNLITISIMYSFFSGGLTNSAPAVVGLLSPELNMIGTRVGMMLTICSLGTLIGAPVAGAILKSQSPTDARGIIDSDRANYDGVFIFSGIGLLVGAVFMNYTRIAKKGLWYFGKV